MHIVWVAQGGEAKMYIFEFLQFSFYSKVAHRFIGVFFRWVSFKSVSASAVVVVLVLFVAAAFLWHNCSS